MANIAISQIDTTATKIADNDLKKEYVKQIKGFKEIVEIFNLLCGNKFELITTII